MAVRGTTPVVRWIRKGSAYVLPLVLSLWMLAGATLAGYYGWDYAQQIFGIGLQPPPTYSPPPKENRILWPTRPDAGLQIGELEIPSVHLKVPVIQGTDKAQLRLGAGHWMDSALPGQPGNVYIAGHRDTVFAPLRGVKTGDTIVMRTTYGDFVYRVTASSVVPETDVSVLDPNTGGQTMTLQTCYPFFYFGYAPDRYLVQARLISSPLDRDPSSREPAGSPPHPAFGKP